MGMFDTVRCDYPLPDPEAQDFEFQTKDLDRLMDTYTITADGRLILHAVHFEDTPEEERPFWGDPRWHTHPFLQVCGMLHAVPDGDKEIAYHGDIVIYDTRLVMSDGSLGRWYSAGPDGWIGYREGLGRQTCEVKRSFEYMVRFTHGRVEWIRPHLNGIFGYGTFTRDEVNAYWREHRKRYDREQNGE